MTFKGERIEYDEMKALDVQNCIHSIRCSLSPPYAK